MRIEHTATITAPVERVWELTTDVEAWPRLMPTVTSVQRVTPGPLQPGSEVTIKQPGQRAKRWTVARVERPHRFVWSTRGFGTTMTAIHELQPAPDGTANTLAIELDGALAPVVGRLLGRSIRSVLETENRSFQAAASP